MLSSSTFAILAIFFVSSSMGHSQMRCAKYNPATGQCNGAIRNENLSKISEAYDMKTGSTGVCQVAYTQNVASQYSNGAACPDWANCPNAMGTYTPGEVFNVMWFARNHAVENQTPGNISLYLSPPITSGQTSDVSAAVFQQNKFCTAPYSSCNGQNGDQVQCYTSCTIPKNTASGTYTLWWKWDWINHNDVTYVTCADIIVTGSSSSTPAPTPAPVPAPTPVPVSPPVSTPVPVSPPVSTPVPMTPPVSTPVPVSPPVSTPVPVSPPVSTPTAPTTPVSSGSCTPGTMKCLGDNTREYSTCTWSVWGASQTCASGTVCSPSGDYIYCLKSTTPVSTPTAPSTPVATPTPTPVTPAPTTPASGTTCVDGYQRCTSTLSSTYQTCQGNVWRAAQNCQTGLSCHPSATANNIYCY